MNDYTASVTCYSCPNQVEGTYQGRGFYFRARHGEWTLHRATRPRAADGHSHIDWDNPVATGDDDWAGYWAPEDFLPLCERLVREHI